MSGSSNPFGQTGFRVFAHSNYWASKDFPSDYEVFGLVENPGYDNAAFTDLSTLAIYPGSNVGTYNYFPYYTYVSLTEPYSFYSDVTIKGSADYQEVFSVGGIYTYTKAYTITIETRIRFNQGSSSDWYSCKSFSVNVKKRS